MPNMVGIQGAELFVFSFSPKGVSLDSSGFHTRLEVYRNFGKSLVRKLTDDFLLVC